VPGSGGGKKCFGFKKSEVRPEKTILQNGKNLFILLVNILVH
jgi:hypothetical protein